MTEILYFPDIEGCYIKEFTGKVMDVKEGVGIIMDATAFYPKGGGQNADGGLLFIDGKEHEVEDVRKDGEVIVHHLASTIGISPGDSVQGVLNWKNRYGNMRMHTAQHLISAIVKDNYGADTVGNQLYPDKARMDFSPLSKQDFEPEEVARIFSEQISKGLSIKIYFAERKDLNSDPRVRISLNRLPPHISNLRVIEIDGYDICPCAGTHIKSLKELRPIEITRAKSKGKGRIRVEYWFVP
ncbi:MAG: alanyl-tRNA editing protein [Candidatus Thermoplasmatota archaeon]|nr:alanyl-tRNA editing protein [Candidatus Thermoplasmatota archaeon]MDP7264808.1 alanyl-tRNA editing protein [Candidatus Thermoplasmatota archaeon]